MEKALRQNHKMSVAEYEGNLSNRIKVEQRREQEYLASKQMISEIDNQLRNK